MVDTRIVLAGLWVVLVLTGLWGDVLRIFADDFVPGEILGMQPTQGMWLGIAAVMLLPIAMILLNLTLPYPVIRWANIGSPSLFLVLTSLGCLRTLPLMTSSCSS